MDTLTQRLWPVRKVITFQGHNRLGYGSEQFLLDTDPMLELNESQSVGEPIGLYSDLRCATLSVIELKDYDAATQRWGSAKRTSRIEPSRSRRPERWHQ